MLTSAVHELFYLTVTALLLHHVELLKPTQVASGADDVIQLDSYSSLAKFASSATGGILRGTFDFTKCRTNFDLGPMAISTMDEYRTWAYVKFTKKSGLPDFIQATRNFLDDRAHWSFLKMEAFANNTVSMRILDLSNTTQEVFNHLQIDRCPIGDGATFFASKAHMSANLKTYDELKNALSAGRPVTTRANYTNCKGIKWKDTDVTSLITSATVEDFEFVTTAGDDEYIHLSHNYWTNEFIPGNVGVESVDVWIRRNGSVQLVPTDVDFLSWANYAPNKRGFTCQLGNSFKAWAPAQGHQPSDSPSRKPTKAFKPSVVYYKTYAEVESALGDSAEIGVTINAPMDCVWTLPPGERNIFHAYKNWEIGHRSLSSDIHPFPPTVGQGTSKDYIQFYGMMYDEVGRIIHEQFRLTRAGSGSLEVTFNVIDMKVPSVSRWTAVCPLTTEASFYGIPGKNSSLSTYAAVENAVLSGLKVSVHATLDSCKGYFKPGTILVSMVRDANIRKLSGKSTMTLLMSDMSHDPASGAFYWGATKFELHSNNTVLVTLRGFNSVTYQDVFQGAGVWSCELGKGVTFKGQ